MFVKCLIYRQRFNIPQTTYSNILGYASAPALHASPCNHFFKAFCVAASHKLVLSVGGRAANRAGKQRLQTQTLQEAFLTG